MRLSYDPTAAAPRRPNRATSAAWRCCSAATPASARSRCCPATRCWTALKRRGVDAHAFDPRDQRARASCSTQRFDRVWIALHGPGGEDGTLQGALEYLGVPYTGSGVMGSAIGMDKLRTKRLAQAIGVATADFVVLRGPAGLRARARAARAAADRQARHAGLERRHDQGRAGGRARRPPTPPPRGSRPLVFAEPWITGKEYTVAILQGGAAVDPHRDAARPSTTTRPSTSATTRATSARRACRRPRRAAPGESRARRLRGRRRRGLGARRFHDGRGRAPAAARDQHHPRHDQPQPGADGRARRSASTSRSWCGACSRRASRGAQAAGAARVSSERARPPQEPPQAHAGARCALPAITWRALGLVGRRPGARRRHRRGASRWALDQPIQTVAVAGRFQRVAPVDVERVVKATVHGAGPAVSVDLGGGAPRHPHHPLGGCGERAARLAARPQRAGDRAGRGRALGRERAAQHARRAVRHRRAPHPAGAGASCPGPDGKESVVAQRYLAAQGRLMQAGLRMTALRLDARGAWEFDLANGVTVRLRPPPGR